MTTTRPEAAPTAAPRSLAVRAATAAAVAATGNAALALLLSAAVDADPDFVGLQVGPVAAASVVGVLAGLVLYVVLRRLGRGRLLVPLVCAGALLSLAGPLGLLGASQVEQPGVSDAAALALIPLHLLVAAVVAVMLPRGDR